MVITIIRTSIYFRQVLLSGVIVMICLVGLRTTALSEETHHDTHKGHDHTAHEAAMETEAAVELIQSVGVDEKTGDVIPLDATFTDENGKQIVLSDIIDRPTIILPIFFYCPVVCPMLLSGLASALNDVPFEAGKDYRVIALSFNDEETPDVAKDSKEDYMRLLPESFPETSWSFLTGNQKEIVKVTDAIGYRFRKTAKNTFVHPNALVVVGEDGTVIRYLYGSVFLGADLGMAVSEAQKGTPGVSIKRILSFCFNYNPEGKRYVVTILKITALVTVIGLVLFFILFLRKSDRDFDSRTGREPEASENQRSDEGSTS